MGICEEALKRASFLYTENGGGSFGKGCAIASRTKGDSKMLVRNANYDAVKTSYAKTSTKIFSNSILLNQDETGKRGENI